MIAHHLVQHIRGDWRRRPPRAEVAARVGEREQRACYMGPGHACDVGGCTDCADYPWWDEICEGEECWCGGAGRVVSPPLRVAIGERVAA